MTPIWSDFTLTTFKIQKETFDRENKIFDQKYLPISQTLSLKPLDCTLLILKPCVGVMCEISSEARTLSNVV